MSNSRKSRIRSSPSKVIARRASRASTRASRPLRRGLPNPRDGAGFLDGYLWGHYSSGLFQTAAPPGAGMAMEGTGLKKKDLKRFREILLAKKKEILRNAQRTLNEDMTLDADDLPDEMDLASSEYLHSFTFRLRGREKVFLQKIDHALEKIKEGTFGVCEQCGEPISMKRLEARLETTLCIRCKEDQERIEKAYG